MNIELNGVAYTKEQIQSGVNKYISYLEGLNSGLYGADIGEVALLELAENKNIESVIDKLQNFQTVDDIGNFDFNASGTSDANDIELLKNIITKGLEKETELQINDKGSVKEIITSGGYKIVTNSNAQNTKIYYPNGSLMTHIHGDPHVDEYNDQGQRTGGWHYADDSTFILPDGTEMVMNSLARPGNIMVNRGIYVKDGDKVAAFGLEFGEGRNNSASDAEEGQTLALRFLDVDAAEWDAAVADINSSNKRNGVFAHVNGQWSRLNSDGNFYDLQNEAWGAYVARQGNDLLIEGESLKVNRDQLIAALDGEDVLTHQSLLDLELGDMETAIINEFLQNKSKFNGRLIQQLSLLKDFGVEKEDLFTVINGGVTGRQANFLDDMTEFFFSLDQSKEVNQSIKDAVLDNYFSLNNRIEREPRSNNPALVGLVNELIDMNVLEGNNFAEFKDQIFDNSIFAGEDIDINKVLQQKFFLEKMNRQQDFIGDDLNTSKALQDLLASKFFDVDAELVTEATELLSDNQEKHIELIEQTLLSASYKDHSYVDQFDELLDKILSPKLAQAIHENDFSIFSGVANRNPSAVRSSRYTAGKGRNSSLLKIVDNFINSKETSFAEFVEKAELILNYQDEKDASAEVVTANTQITESIVNLKLDELRSQQDSLQSQLDAISDSNSRFDVRKKRDLSRSLRSLSSEISGIISALGA